MSRKPFWRTGVLAAALAVVLALAGAAVAAGGSAPTLLSPNHHRVSPGRVKLVVAVPLKPAPKSVFITIAPKRKLDRSGHLKECAGNRCDFVSPKHWKGDKYRYVAPFNFSGYWSVTPGKYYWQVHYYRAGTYSIHYSGIGWFIVK